MLCFPEDSLSVQLITSPSALDDDYTDYNRTFRIESTAADYFNS